MKMQIVVARYNENIDHLKILNDIIVVYNKGNNNIYYKFNNIINLINVGREGHTYLYHIINNYYNLANQTFFMQAKTSDHKMLDFIEYLKNNDFIGKLSTLSTELLKKNIIFDKKYLKEFKIGLLLKSKYNPYDFITNILGIDINNDSEFNMVWGANFVVSRELIHKKPIEFYKNIIKYLEYHNNPEEGHFFERSWYLIYKHPNFTIKNKILYYYSDNINTNIIKKCESIIIDNIDVDEIHIWTNKISNKELNIKYLNNYQYINIYPIIKNNSFTFEYTNICNLILEFDIDIFEIFFTQSNIKIYNLKNTNEYIFDIPMKDIKSFIIKWDEELYIDQYNIHFKSTNLINVKVKSYDSFINYNVNEIYYKKTYIFYTILNRVNKIFYKDNFEDRYTCELNSDYLI
jgi:hypothetical protein